jgi:nucleotide-binding universal stress UspA family protein
MIFIFSDGRFSMSIRSIVALADGNDLHSVLSAAVALTGRLSARLDVLHIRADPYDMIPIGVEGMTGNMIDEIVDAAKKAIDDRCARAKAAYDRVCSPSGQYVSWKETVGRSAHTLSVASRFADLLVLAQPQKDSPDTLLEAVDAAMFETGRPLVLVPSGVSSVIGNRIMIAWNGSTQAALAVTAALPLLHMAGQVDIVQVGDIDKEAPTSELPLYLSLHAIKSQLHATDLGIHDVGGALIDAAERFKSDLIVVGAYGHSRFRERILGGATRDLLANSPRPLFMMH